VQALKDVVAQLRSVGEASRIVEVAYRYLEIVDGKREAAAKPLRITMTTATKESQKDIDAKKAMLGAHCAVPAVHAGILRVPALMCACMP
jgi:hypothetical protein